MKWITTAIALALALATNSCAEGQDDINFVLDQKDARGIRGQQQQVKSKFKNKEVLVDSDSTPLLLPKKSSVEKPESVGVLSNDKESITSVDPRDETVLSELSQPLDVEDRQAQSQGRRLESDALQAFQAHCDATTTSGETGTGAYVDCVGGLVSGDTSTSCATACDGKCCTGSSVTCNAFTGKVCKDGSCNGGGFACGDANIDYVVGPSCTNQQSCTRARIGSVDSSCNDVLSCQDARLSGVDLINSCNAGNSCSDTIGNGAFDELIDCCNGFSNQCEDEVGLDIVAAGGATCRTSTTGSPSKAPTSSPSQSPSKGPSTSPTKNPTMSPTTLASAIIALLEKAIVAISENNVRPGESEIAVTKDINKAINDVNEDDLAGALKNALKARKKLRLYCPNVACDLVDDVIELIEKGLV